MSKMWLNNRRLGIWTVLLCAKNGFRIENISEYLLKFMRHKENNTYHYLKQLYESDKIRFDVSFKTFDIFVNYNDKEKKNE